MCWGSMGEGRNPSQYANPYRNSDEIGGGTGKRPSDRLLRAREIDVIRFALTFCISNSDVLHEMREEVLEFSGKSTIPEVEEFGKILNKLGGMLT